MTAVTRRFSLPVIVLGAAALAFAAAFAVRWLCDDIFITLRYADQFLAGNGFVYNPGERVEGYTNFLWLLLITAAQAAGLDPAGAVVAMGLAAFVATVAVFAVISFRMERDAAVVIPFTALALAANTESAIWATSGLETSFFTLLLSLAFFVAFFSNARVQRRILACATLLVLAAMTRPDGLVIYATAGAAVGIRALRGPHAGRGVVRDVALFALPLVVLYGPYAAWKISYYGSFFPNTYYAKSGWISYYSLGFYYLWLYVRAHPTSVLFVLAAVPLALRRGRHLRAAAVTLAAVVVYLVVFVARVGGDFMFARFVAPTLPFVYWLVEWTVRNALGRRRIVRVAVFLLIPLFVYTVERGLRDRLLLTGSGYERTVQVHRGILDEHHFYTVDRPIDRERAVGLELREVFDGLDATVVLSGQACLGYYARFATCIERGGLTDSVIAHQPLLKRGRVGHEKAATSDYLIARGTDFSFERNPSHKGAYRIFEMWLPEHPIAGEIITYDRNLMDQLESRLDGSFHFARFESVLDAYIANELPVRTIEEVQADYEDFRDYYFMHNDDPERELPFLRRLYGDEE